MNLNLFDQKSKSINVSSSVSMDLLNMRKSVSISVLPETPLVFDRWGRQLNSTKIGPTQEGEDIILSCRVVGGKLLG